MSYSTEEVDTGAVWIDGRKIYKKTFKESNVTLVSQRDTIVFNNINIDPLNIIFFEASASFVYGGDKSCIGYDYLNPYIRGTTIRVSQNYTGSTINAEIKITAYYVKS